MHLEKFLNKMVYTFNTIAYTPAQIGANLHLY